MLHRPLSVPFAALLGSVAAPVFAAMEDISQLENLSPGFGLPAPDIGRNIDGGSVFTNFFQAHKDGQFFWQQKALRLYEEPATEAISFDGVMWCSDLIFSKIQAAEGNDTANADMPALGFTGHCLWGLTGNAEQVIDQMAESGAQHDAITLLPDAFVVDLSMSAVFVPQLNSFDINFHINVDNLVFRLRDDGRPRTPYLSWEVHDEGSLDPNAATSSWGGTGFMDWITATEAASLLNLNAAGITPSSFPRAYKDLWIKNHRREAGEKNPEGEAELVIVEEVEETELASDVPNKPSLVPGIENISDLENLVPGVGSPAPVIGENIEGGSVFTNFFKAYKNGQFFLKNSKEFRYERPGSELVVFGSLLWCSDLAFTNSTNFEDNVNMSSVASDTTLGFTGQCVGGASVSKTEFVDSGATIQYDMPANEFHFDISMSGVFAHQVNGFEISFHFNTDNLVWRMLDDGRATSQSLQWEVHDEGDIDPNAGSSSFTGLGLFQWIAADEMSLLMNMDVAELTPTKFLQVYKNLWIKTHKDEAFNLNPEGEAELDIVEEVEETELEVPSKPTPVPTIDNIFDLENHATGFGSPAPLIGRNVEGDSVFTNFYQAYSDGQFFLRSSIQNDYEKPGTKLVKYDQLVWCGDLTFSDFEVDDNIPLGFTGRCLGWASVSKQTLVESGAQIPYDVLANEYFLDLSISGVFVPQLNAFDVSWHHNTDNLVYRMFDDGRATSQTLQWEVHDEGDMDPNAGSSSLSGFGSVQWISTNETAALMDMDVADLASANFMQMYENLWIRNHDLEAEINNPEPEAELDIIEEVKGETDAEASNEEPTEDTTSPGAGKKLGSAICKLFFVVLLYFGGTLM